MIMPLYGILYGCCVCSIIFRSSDLPRRLLTLRRIQDSSSEFWHRIILIHLVFIIKGCILYGQTSPLSLVLIPRSLLESIVVAGLAIKDFWQVDDRTIVFVADPTFGNILNFNVGASVDLDVPRSFWSRLAGKYGNIFYWKEKGEDASVEAAVLAISSCLREPVGQSNCSEVK
eukprot:TRINITY_DN1472_c0_g2_i3.p1 TRINITY_DN1472_c0_g2~~TRINITY_DN1472_c0_g2_i3.p1  ORF type:complete len:173 (+),score=19.89 TRINITY_DN1472_c0_g2_i3:1333-1851(+)